MFNRVQATLDTYTSLSYSRLVVPILELKVELIQN